VTIRPLDEIRDRSLARPRFFAALLAGFALVGLLLSMVGVYGVLAQAARNRARETGIRIALGARAMDVQWMFVHHGLRLAAAGLAIGAALAFVATRAMTTLLFGVKPYDPVTFLVVGILLAATSALAAWIPAARASREDPISALRSD
jgi:ABC-type antimicrobial peptide transport system permease subunit